MSLLEDIAEEWNVGTPNGCWFQVKLNDDQRGAVSEAMAAGYGVAAVRRGLSKNGVSLGETSVGRHLRGECRCL